MHQELRANGTVLHSNFLIQEIHKAFCTQSVQLPVSHLIIFVFKYFAIELYITLSSIERLLFITFSKFAEAYNAGGELSSHRRIHKVVTRIHIDSSSATRKGQFRVNYFIFIRPKQVNLLRIDIATMISMINCLAKRS